MDHQPTSDLASAAAGGLSVDSGRSFWSDARRRLARSPTAMICLGVIALYALAAVVAPLAYADWQGDTNYAQANQPPSADRLLGTDTFGRSVLAKTLLATKVAMTVGLVTNLIAIPLGMLLGAVAGSYGQWLDDAIVWFYTTLAAVPGIIRVIALKFAFQGKVLFAGTAWQLDLAGMGGVCVALAMTYWIGTCRLVRAETLKLRELDYVLAARAAGRGRLSILLRHILPNVAHIGVINFSLGFVGAVTAEVILSYLGLGVQVGQPSWGGMINAARTDLIVGRWWELTAAVTAMFVLVLALNILGDRLRDALDPKLRNA